MKLGRKARNKQMVEKKTHYDLVLRCVLCWGGGGGGAL